MFWNRLILTGLIIQSAVFTVSAQSVSQKLEVGGQITVLRLKEPIARPSNLCFETVALGPDFSRNIAGLGGRASYKLIGKFSLDGEVSYFPEKPQEHFIQSDPRWQGLFGARAGISQKRFAVFAKGRAGFLYFNRLSRITSIDQQFLSPFGCVFQLIASEDEKRWVFDLDLGGTVEVYLPKRIYLRIDTGDTIIHYPTRSPAQFNPGFTTHNLQFSAGIGIRF